MTCDPARVRVHVADRGGRLGVVQVTGVFGVILIVVVICAVLALPVWTATHPHFDDDEGDF